MISIDFLILADFAEVLNSKLYLQGGGWNTLTVADPFPLSRHIGIAAGFNVPWADTNRGYPIQIEVENEDTGVALVTVDGQLETGRPPGIAPGSDQLVIAAFNGVVTLDRPGQYVVRASVDGSELKRVPFTVNQRKVTLR